MLIKLLFLESFYTDSTFDDDDLISEADPTGDAADKWSPDVYFHSYLDMKVSRSATSVTKQH